MQLQPQAVPVTFRIPLDQEELFHGVEQSVNCRLIQTQSGRQLGDAESRAVVAHVDQNAQGLLQGLAGACLAPCGASFPAAMFWLSARLILGYRSTTWVL